MTNLGTQPSNVNPDPTKWRDRIGEFGSSATSSVSIGAIIATASSAFAATTVAISVAGAPAPAAVVGGVASGASGFITAFFFLIAAAFAKSKAAHPRPLARKLGLVFPSLVALSTSGFVTHNIFTAEPPPTTVPDVIFNATAQDCDSEQVKATISKIKADGFSVACAKLAP